MGGGRTATQRIVNALGFFCLFWCCCFFREGGYGGGGGGA